MKAPPATAERLVAEVERYLRAVDTFRREGCEPNWRRETSAAPRSGAAARP